MFIFINPWTSYDPDDIPSLYSGDPEIDKQVMWAVIYSIVISMNVESLMSILERTPGDYEVFVKYADFEISLKDIVEVDISKKKLVLK